MKKIFYVVIVAITLIFANTICVAQTRKIKCDHVGKATPENPFYECDYYAENDETWSAPDIDCEIMPNFQGKAEKGTQYMKVSFTYSKQKDTDDSVVCQFTASANGMVNDVKMLHGTSPKYNNDVVGIIKATPNWSPGKKVVVVYLRERVDISPIAVRPEEGNKDNGEENVLDAYSIKIHPEFPGGNAEMWKWLCNHIEYPKQYKGPGGRVVCEFIINKDGSISDIKVIRSVDPALDQEVVRVLSIMPKWNPGRQHGKPVRTKYWIPINLCFMQEDSDTTTENSPLAESPKEEDDDTRIFTVAEQMPMFPDGLSKCMQWINSNLRYPQK